MDAFGQLDAVNAAQKSASYVTKNAQAGSGFSWHEIQLTIIIFIFGLIATLLFYLLVKTGKFDQFLMRIYVVIILVFGSLLVVSSGYATDQVAPVIGFFGTIAGYLLGRSEIQGDKKGDAPPK